MLAIKKLVTPLFLFLFAGSAFAQGTSGTISGTVKDSQGAVRRRGETRLTPPLTPAEAATLSICLSPDFEVERQPFLINRSAN